MVSARILLILFVLFPVFPDTSVLAQDSTGRPPQPVRLGTGTCGNTCRSSPFDPPKCNDTTFVIDCATKLDTGCTFRSGGPLVFTIKVGRYVGNLQKLKQSGLISSTATIQMPAFDVDFAGASGVNPERDRVFFNGRQVPTEFLIGADNTWIMNQFVVPIEWVNFPQSDPGPGGTVTPADNVIRIDIDTANTNEVWCTSIDWASLTFDVARPLVMVHGILSSGSAWDQSDFSVVQKLTELGLPSSNRLNMGPLDSIQNNAGKISGEVTNAMQRWGVDKVNLLCHSKGGLDSRHFAESIDMVERVIQLGTPNAGSPLANYAQGLRVIGLFTPPIVGAFINRLANQPAAIQLTTPYMSFYNSTHGYNPRVSYTALAGDYDPACNSGFQCRVDKFLNFIVGRGDTIVPVDSVHALGFTSNLTYASAGENRQATHTGLNHSADVFATVQGPIVNFGTNSHRTAAMSATVAHTASIVNSISQGQVKTASIIVDQATPTSFALFYPSGNLNLALISPSGQRFDATNIAGNPNVEYGEADILGGLLEVLSFNSPEVGAWTVEVSAPSVVDPSGTVAYAVSGWFENPAISFAGTLGDSTIRLGEKLRLLGTLKNGAVPIQGATVIARIMLPDETTATVTLRDDGTGGDTVANDGVYTGEIVSTKPGAHRIVFSASRTGSGSVAFSREDFSLATVSASSTAFSGSYRDFGVDTNANSLFNQLAVEVGITVSTAAKYRILGVLKDSQGRIQTASTLVMLTPGARTATLLFDGELIYRNGVNGPYQLSELQLAEENETELLPVEERTNTYQTTAYSFTQFEHTAVNLNGINTSDGVDTNGNGKFDLLKIGIGVNIDNPGLYQWSARLFDRNGADLGFASSTGQLQVGANTLRLDFAGRPIGANRTDGPYRVRGLLIFGSGASLVSTDVFATQAFQARQFEGFPEGSKFEAANFKSTISEPLACTGSGNVLSVQSQFKNTGDAAQNDNSGNEFVVGLAPYFRGIVGSCIATGAGGALKGTCSVGGTQVVWSGSVAVGETITIKYQVQLADGTLTDTNACINSVINFDSDGDRTNDATTNLTTCVKVNCPAVGPGMPIATSSPVSDQKAGSVLFYNVYTSSTDTNRQNTRINLTNIHPSLKAYVHLFFVDGSTCTVADSMICLTPNQTTSFLASDIDPGTTGYMVAVAVDGVTGCPINFNYLVGDEYVKFASGHAANLGAEAVTAIAGGLPACNADATTALLAFDGVSYSALPRALALDNIASRGDGNDTLLILNRIGGNLATGAATLTGLFGLFYDDSETALSFTFSPGTCQFRSSISNTFPRITPRFESFVPAGRSGWIRFYSQNDQGILGAAINFNSGAAASSSAFNQGHNLHKLTLTPNMVLSIPIFPPSC